MNRQREQDERTITKLNEALPGNWIGDNGVYMMMGYVKDMPVFITAETTIARATMKIGQVTGGGSRLTRSGDTEVDAVRLLVKEFRVWAKALDSLARYTGA